MNVEAQIEKLSPGPDDVLVVRTGAPLSEDAVVRLREQIRRTEVGCLVVLLDEGDVSLADRARLAEQLGLEDEAVRSRLRRVLVPEPGQYQSLGEFVDEVIRALREEGVPLPVPKEGGDA